MENNLNLKNFGEFKYSSKSSKILLSNCCNPSLNIQMFPSKIRMLKVSFLTSADRKRMGEYRMIFPPTLSLTHDERRTPADFFDLVIYEFLMRMCVEKVNQIHVQIYSFCRKRSSVKSDTNLSRWCDDDPFVLYQMSNFTLNLSRFIHKGLFERWNRYRWGTAREVR